MDQRNKTDQFFREKLDQIEFQPSEQAWNKVQGSISSKSVIPWITYLRIAAGFALILALGIIFYPWENDTSYSLDQVTSPQPLELAAIDIRDPESREIKVHQPNTKVEIASKSITQKAKDQSNSKIRESEILKNERKPLELLIIEDIQIADANIAIKAPELIGEVNEEGVKITYYTARSNVGTDIQEEIKEEDSLKTNLIDKMRFFARNVSPVELITDLRTAKEELIENGLRKN